jgi:hypothetical protein
MDINKEICVSDENNCPNDDNLMNEFQVEILLTNRFDSFVRAVKLSVKKHVLFISY